MTGIKRQMQDILVELIQMNSETKKDKEELVEYVKGIVEDLGLTVEPTNNSPSPVLLASNGEPGSVVFSGHLDIPLISDDWNYSQGQIVNGKIYGCGTSSMKGAIVAMLFAAQELVKRNIPVALSFTTDEESEMDGATYFSKNMFIRKSAAIVVGEPTSLKVGIAEKGVLDLVLSIHGKSSHSANPSLGDNAIIKTMRIIRSIDNFKDKYKDPLLDQITVNIGTIKGGTRMNMVPSKCEVGIDVRYPPPYTGEEIYTMLKEHLLQHKKKFVLTKIFELPAISMNPSSAHIKTMLDISKSALQSMDYTTEAVKYYDVNNNIVIFGCGDEELAYQADEFVRLEDIIKASEVYRKFAIAIHENRTNKQN